MTGGPLLPPGLYEVTRRPFGREGGGLWEYRLGPSGEAPAEALARPPDGACDVPDGPDPYRAVFALASPHLGQGRVLARLDGRRARLWFLPAGG